MITALIIHINNTQRKVIFNFLWYSHQTISKPSYYTQVLMEIRTKSP